MVACNLASSISPAPAHPRLPALAGYGGGGAACGDLWALHLEGSAIFRWEELSPSGPAPAPRFDHTAVALPTAPNSQQPDKLVVLGGRDSAQQFADAVHVLDLETMMWQAAHGVPALGDEVRHGACSLGYP